MEGWTVHDEIWWRRDEQLAHDRHLVCFLRRKDDGRIDFPAGWVVVLTMPWEVFAAQGNTGTLRLEHICIEEPSHLLEVECVAEEMRKKYRDNVVA